jgi:hypothetical protein
LAIFGFTAEFDIPSFEGAKRFWVDRIQKRWVKGLLFD